MKGLRTLQKILLVLGVFALPVVLDSCGGESTVIDGRSQGIITYEIQYTGMDPNSALIEVLPSEFTVKFKDNKIKTMFKTIGSIVELNIIADGNSHEMANCVKFFGARYVLKTTASDPFRLGQSLGEFEIEPTDDVKEIAGYEAKKFTMTYANSGQVSEVFVTDQIDIVNPNWCTVYGQIDQMLLEYDMEQYDIRMHLTATEVKYVEISDDEFNVDADSKILEEEEFNKVVRDNLKILLEDF